LAVNREMDQARLLERGETGLLVIDVQQPLLDLMWNQQGLVANVRRLAQGAQILGLPVLVAEQNPERLGATAECVADVLQGLPRLAKMAFSCCREEHVMEALRAAARPTWLLCGMEAHVCVSQTALDLLAQAHKVHVASDAVGSRVQANWEAGLERARGAGAIITTTEMALFELLERADVEQFKAVHRLVR
jgi:nicotinamidase-related amidase